MDTKARIVEAARDLFWRKGYHATSVNDILAQAEAGSGSLYYFFKDKEDVLAAVLRHYLELLQPMIMEPAIQKHDDPFEQAFGVLDVYRTGLIESNFHFACPIGRIALEVSDPGNDIRDLLDENFRRWAESLEARLNEADDRLPPESNRRELARFFLTVMEGAVMQAATARDIEPFDSAVKHLRTYLSLLTDGHVAVQTL